jgi:DNA-binding response OmpR family regulator
MGVATPVQTDVVLVHWPEDEGRRQALVAQGAPCLLLVAPDCDPPVLEGNLEDWIRVPADERDLYARIRRLHDLAAPLADLPTVDEEDLFHHGGRWIGLPASEAALARVLLANFGKLVGRQQLETELLTGGEGSRVIDSQVHRLRHRIAPLRFTVTAVRGRGYVLENSPQGE